MIKVKDARSCALYFAADMMNVNDFSGRNALCISLCCMVALEVGKEKA